MTILLFDTPIGSTITATVGDCFVLDWRGVETALNLNPPRAAGGLSHQTRPGLFRLRSV